MDSDQDAQTLPLTKHQKQTEGTSVDTDDFADLKRRGLNFRPLLRMIQRNILMIAGVNSAVVVALALSGTKAPRSYEGTFRILVEPITSDAKFSDPGVISRDGANSMTTGIDYPTLLQVLQSRGLLSKITKEIQVKDPAFPANALSKFVTVQRLGTNLLDSAKIIEVRYGGGDPQTVQLALQELAKGYLRYSLEDRKTRIGGGVQFIEDQLPRLQQRVDDLEGELQVLQQRYRLSDPESEGQELAKQVRDIETQKLGTQRDLQEQKTLYSILKRQLGLAPDEAIAASALSEDPRYQALLTQLKTIESQIAIKSARFSEDSPVVQALREQQKNLSSLLDQEAQRILGQTASNQASDPQALTFQNSIRIDLIKQLVETVNKGQVLEVRNQSVSQTKAALDQQLQQFPELIRRYTDLKRQRELAAKTLDQLLIQRETLRVEAAQKEVPWEIVSAPDLVRDAGGNPMPVARGTGKKLALGALAGFMLALGLAALIDKFRNIFYTTEDIQDAIRLPLLGVIPFNKTENLFGYSKEIAGLNKKPANRQVDNPLFQEAFNSLYAGFCFLTADTPVRSLVVSSAAPGDGKTTIALHLAQVAATLGRRVLLVDANLRLPQLHTQLGLPNSMGLSELLAQNVPIDDFVQQSTQDNLAILTSGHPSPDSTRLLASARMQQLMEQCQAAFDLVIYDTPHVLGLADTNFLAAQSDGILFVIGVGKTNRSVVMQVLNGLNAFRLPILGVVANQIKAGSKASYGYHPPYYEAKQSRSTLVKKLKAFNPSLLMSGKSKDA